jgi:hypothetical protein
MTNKQVMQLMTELGLHDGGMLNWIKDNAYVKFARKLETLVRDDERKKCVRDYLQDTCNAIDLVRIAEREACAKLLDDFSKTQMVPAKDTWRMGVVAAANAVRDKK